MTISNRSEPTTGADPQAAALARAAGWAGPKAPTLAFRLDEAAAAIHPVTLAKVVMTVLGGLMALLIMPWHTCLTWVAGGVALEVWGWFATRAQFRGVAIGWRQRVLFIVNYLMINGWWLLLSGLLWGMGTVEGHAAGVVILLALASVFVLLVYNTPAVFLAAGAIPAIGALTVLGLADDLHWRQLLPVWLSLGLSMIFALGRAIDTPSAQESQRRVADSLNKYKILAENVTDIIARTDMEGEYQYVSPAAFEMLGYRPDEMVGTTLRAMVHPDDMDELNVALGLMIADPIRSEVVTMRTRHKDGRWLWLQTSVKLIREQGVPVALIGVGRDVTERVAADLALREAKAEAESATRAKAEFLANVSHEIRTPMNGVLGALHLLESEPISPEGRELMRQANDCGRMLSQLLNDVLDFSKIEAGQLDLAPEPLHAGEALRGVIALLDDQARAKGVELRCEIAGEDLWIAADPVRLRQAMFNLIGNAVKFTAKGHVAARLSFGDLSDGRRRIRFEVEDTGIGMSPEAQSHMFERFRQAESDTARRFGGTGLGLAITRAVARMMGGDIGFTSVEGQGSTFWLDFDAPAAEPVVAAVVEAGLLEGLNVLLVEDNATNRLIARTLLSRLGATVEEAEDGVLGLAAARSVAHDLILMDVQMPHMDGIEATRAIRGLRGPVSRVPIIGLTANVMVHQRAEYAAAGMDGVVGKPISPGALLAEIARLMAPERAKLTG